MCGLAAIFSYLSPAAPVQLAELEKMSSSMARRGPDGQGIWISDEGRIGLAHRRLAIIDPDPRSLQPMSSHDGKFRIVFNGEIYNYRQLRAELERSGARFRTTSDTEVILEAFRVHGTAMFRKLRGMFAIALFEVETQTLVLARDPLGIKPLYYADDGWSIRAASQVKAILAGGAVSTQKDPAGLVGFLLHGSIPEPFTTMTSIRSLPAGCFLTVSVGRAPRMERFRCLARTILEAPQIGVDEAIGAVGLALKDTVAHHLVSDVPIGTFQSAGIDSSVILKTMSECSPDRFQAHTIVFEDHVDTSLDESSPARNLTRSLNQSHHVRHVSNTELLNDLPDFMNAMDLPTIDGINGWFAAKACRESGLRVAISGVGGDEWFGGYPSFSSVPRWHRLSWLPSRIPGVGAATRTVARPILEHFRPGLARGAGLVEYAGTWAGAYFLRRALFMPYEIPELIGRELAMAGLERLNPLERLDELIQPDPGNSFARVVCLEAGAYLRNQLLRDADWASMAHGVEVRTPLVDWTFVEAIAPLIRHHPKLVTKKLLVGALTSPLPDEIASRRKTGFSGPMVHSRWLADAANFVQITGRDGMVPGGFKSGARNMAALVWHSHQLGAD